MALALSRPTLTLTQADRLAELTDAERASVSQRRAIVDSWRNICASFASAGKKRTDATTAFLAANEGLSKSTLYRWAQLRDSEDPTDLLDRRSKSLRPAAESPVEGSPDCSCSEDAWAYFKSLWLTIQRRSTALCWQIVNVKAQEVGWLWPSLRSLQRRCQAELPAFKSDYFRLGEREWARRHAPKITRDFTLYRANEWWVGDFHECDVFCRKSDTDPTIVRPLLSAFLDLRSRVLVGWHICLAENSDNILLAVRRGAVDYGIPDHVIIDNGKPYKAYGVSGGRPTLRRKVDDEEYVRSVFGGLGICTHFSIPFNPDSKIIERWFGTLESQFGCTFSSYCGGDKDERFRAAHKLSKEHPEQCPTVQQFAEALDGYLTAYHATPHSGEGMNGLSPEEAFRQFDPIAMKVAPEGALDMLLLRPHGQRRDRKKVLHGIKVTSAGVLYMGDHYGQRDDVLREWQGKEVLLRVDPDDAGWVLVCDMEGKPICKAYNNRRFFAALTQDNLREGMKEKAKARRMCRDLQEGAMRPLMQDVTEAGIAARLAAGKAAQQERAALGTGTDDQPAPRNVQPLRSDFADALQRLQRGESRTRSQLTAEPQQSFEQTVAELTAADSSAAGPQQDADDLASIYEEL